MNGQMKCEWCDRPSTLGLSVRRNGELRVYGICRDCSIYYHSLDDNARDAMLAEADA